MYLKYLRYWTSQKTPDPDLFIAFVGIYLHGEFRNSQKKISAKNSTRRPTGLFLLAPLV
jgi:hypothetical protein